MRSPAPYGDHRDTPAGEHERRATPAPESPSGHRAARSTIDHLRRALAASCAEAARAVRAALTRAVVAIDETRHPEIAAAIRIARGVDPLSTTIRCYIRRTLQRLVAVINLWETAE